MAKQKAIDVTAGGTSFTGKGIDLYRLLTIRMGLRLEMRGMRLTAKAPKCSTILRREYGIKGNREKQMAQLEKLIEQCQTECAQQNAEAEMETATIH
jgi:hypothetical protein